MKQLHYSSYDHGTFANFARLFILHLDASESFAIMKFPSVLRVAYVKAGHIHRICSNLLFLSPCNAYIAPVE